MNFKRAIMDHVQEHAPWENVSHVQWGGTMCQDIMGMQLRFINTISSKCDIVGVHSKKFKVLKSRKKVLQHICG